jgi:hypothetical protein
VTLGTAPGPSHDTAEDPTFLWHKLMLIAEDKKLLGLKKNAFSSFALK